MTCVEPTKRKQWILEGEMKKSRLHWSNFHNQSALAFLDSMYFSTIIKAISNIHKEKRRVCLLKSSFIKQEIKILLFAKFWQPFGSHEYLMSDTQHWRFLYFFEENLIDF